MPDTAIKDLDDQIVEMIEYLKSWGTRLARDAWHHKHQEIHEVIEQDMKFGAKKFRVTISVTEIYEGMSFR